MRTHISIRVVQAGARCGTIEHQLLQLESSRSCRWLVLARIAWSLATSRDPNHASRREKTRGQLPETRRNEQRSIAQPRLYHVSWSLALWPYWP